MSDVVARAKAALEGVTEGPWDRHDFGYGGEQEPSSIVIHAGKFDWQAIRDGDFIASTAQWDGPEDRNASFIAASRSLVPELVAEVERLRGAAAALELREETAFKYTHNASGKHMIIESSADVRIAGKIAGDTHTLTPVQRYVTPWMPLEATESDVPTPSVQRTAEETK